MALAILAMDSREAVIKFHIVSERMRCKLIFASINAPILGLFLLSHDWQLHIQPNPRQCSCHGCGKMYASEL